MRLSWEEYALQLANVAALRSQDVYRKVGAVALDYDNRVIGVAYNGLMAGKDVDQTFWDNREYRRKYMLHAEQNLLALIKRGECALLACTHLPCSSCATSIIAHKIPKVVYHNNYENDQNALDIFDFYNINLKQYNEQN